MSEKAEKIFATAVEMTGESLEAYLQSECGIDADLRQEVETLLDDAKLADDYFGLEDETVSMASGTQSEPSGKGGEQPGDRIGPFELLEQIGEGGFGIVFLAQQQQPIQRKVALKVVKPGMDSKEVLARFEAERQALAMLDHSNIARVFDAGATESGRPFFVMEWVDGVSLTQFCDERRLSTRERLGIFREICAAIQYAHQKGVIHRDIKPSNILVSEEEGTPVVKVIDFGIAKSMNQSLTERTLFTARGQLLGTPQYMSPEQSSGDAIDVDTRSDIYSLGVVLYEMVTGRAPFDPGRLKQAALDEVIRIIREEEPARPSVRWRELSKDERTELTAARGATSESRIRRQVRGDLDKIVMKSLEKNRDRRYDSVADFAADIERFLNCEPVEARAPSGFYRFRKYARRNKGKVAAAAVLTAAFLFLVPFSVLAAMAATKEEQRSVAAAEEAAAVVAFFRDNVLAAANPVSYGGMGIDTTIYDALAELEPKMTGAFVDRPVVEASIRKTLGQTFLRLGETSRAIRELEAAVRIYRKTEGMASNRTWDLMMELADAYNEVGKSDEEIDLLAEVVGAQTIHSSLAEPESLETLQDLASRYADYGRQEEASRLRQREFDHFRGEVEMLTEKFGADSLEALKAMSDLADALKDAGYQEEAKSTYLETISRCEKALGKNHDATLSAMGSLAYIYHTQKDYDALLEIKKEIFERRLTSLGESNETTIIAMDEMAHAYYYNGQLPEAVRWAEKALSRFESLGSSYPYFFNAANQLPMWRKTLGREETEDVSPSPDKEGEKKVKEIELALANSIERWGEDSPQSLDQMEDLAEALEERGNVVRFGKILEEIVDLRRPAFGKTHDDTLRAIRELIQWHRDYGDIDTAIEISRENAELVRSAGGTASKNTLIELGRHAELCFFSGRFDEAERFGIKLLGFYRNRRGKADESSFSTSGISALSKLASDLDFWSTLHAHPLALAREEPFHDLNLRLERIAGTDAEWNSDSLDFLMELSTGFQVKEFRVNPALEARTSLSRFALKKAKVAKGPSSPEVLTLIKETCFLIRRHESDEDAFAFLADELEDLLKSEELSFSLVEDLIETTIWYVCPIESSERNVERAKQLLALTSPRRPQELLLSLGFFYQKLEHWEDAIKVTRELLDLAENSTNGQSETSHEKTNSVDRELGMLAYLYDESGQPEKAIEAYEQLFETRKKSLSPEVFFARNGSGLANLAKWLSAEGRSEEAESIRSSLADHAASLLADCEHPTATAPRLAVLAETLRILHLAQRDEEILQLTGTLRSEIDAFIAKGPIVLEESEETIALSKCISNLESAEFDGPARRLREFAVRPLEQKLKTSSSEGSGLSPESWKFLGDLSRGIFAFDRIFDLDILETITSLYLENRFHDDSAFNSFDTMLTRRYSDSGIITESEMHEIELNQYGGIPADQLESISAIGEILTRRGKYKLAEARLLYAHRGLQLALFSTEQERLIPSFERLIGLYEDWGKPDETALWKGHLEKFKKGLQ